MRKEIRNTLTQGHDGKICFKNKRPAINPLRASTHTRKDTSNLLKATEEQPSEYEDDQDFIKGGEDLEETNEKSSEGSLTTELQQQETNNLFSEESPNNRMVEIYEHHRRTLANTTSPKKTTMRLHKTITSSEGTVFMTKERLKRTTRMNHEITKLTERLLRESQDSKVGENALIKQIDYIRDGAKMVEKCELEGKTVDNAMLQYLNTVMQKRKAPKGFGLVARKKKDEINLQSFYLRESYIDAFSEGLKMSNDLMVLNLSRNQLTTNRVIKILLKLPRGLKELNLSNNPNLGNETFRVLAEEVLDNPNSAQPCKLEKLILEGVKLTDTGLKPLARVLEYNNTLKFLDLSRNLLREPGAIELANMLLGNGTLTVLFLHWNKFQPRGGTALARALCKNGSLQILDLSYCSLGGSRENMDKVI